MQPLDCSGEKLDLILCYFQAVPGHWGEPIDAQSRWEPRGLAGPGGVIRTRGLD